MAETFTTDMRIFYAGTNATVPTDFTRDTAFDGRYLQGTTIGESAAIDVDRTTHTHTSPQHNHSSPTHVHTQSGGTGTGSSFLSVTNKTSAALLSHSHIQNNSGADTSGVNFTAVTFTSDVMDQPFVKVIVIQPDDNNQTIPDDGIVLADRDLSASLTLADGDGGTPTGFDGARYLLGADTAGDGNGIGGDETHNHTSPAHTHTSPAHDVPFPNSSGGPVSFPAAGTSGGTNAGSTSHIHTLSYNNTTVTLQTTVITISPASNHPLQVDLEAYINTSGSSIEIPEGTVVGYVGTPASIPENWKILAGTSEGGQNAVGRQIRVNTVGTGAVIGVNEHIHLSGGTHIHIANAHTHSLPLANNPAGSVGLAPARSGFGYPGMNPLNPHTHTWTIGSTTTVINSNGITVNPADGRQSYRRVHWIVFQKPTIFIQGGDIRGANIL